MDIQTRFIDMLEGADFAADSGMLGLAEDDGLETAILISLFTDARADGPLDDGDLNLRGWWGDRFSPVAGDEIGSQLWRMTREKDRPDTLVRVKGYAQKALDWMIEDGLAESVMVQAWRYQPGVLALAVEVVPSVGAKKRFEFKF